MGLHKNPTIRELEKSRKRNPDAYEMSNMGMTDRQFYKAKAQLHRDLFEELGHGSFYVRAIYYDKDRVDETQEEIRQRHDERFEQLISANK